MTTTNDTPFPVNPTANVVDEAIDGVFNVAIAMVEAAVTTYLPALEAPVIDVITNEVIKLIANAIYKQFALFVTFEIIDVQTDAEANASLKALAVLKKAQTSGDPNAIAAALTQFQAATVSLTHFDGAGPS